MKCEASITGKRQITIPKDVYGEMGLNSYDKLVFYKNESGEVVVTKKETNKLDVCPICEKEVSSDEIMVVNKSQKYHMKCWMIENKSSGLEDINYTMNKASSKQLEAIKKIVKIKNEEYIELAKSLKDDELLIELPTKISFMKSKPDNIGMIQHISSNKLTSINEY